MGTQLNYYTNEEAHMKVCPEVQFRSYKGQNIADPLHIHCIGSHCAEWLWHKDLNDEGERQGCCGVVNQSTKKK